MVIWRRQRYSVQNAMSESEPLSPETVKYLEQGFAEWFNGTFPDYRVKYPLNKTLAYGMARASYARGVATGFKLPHDVIEEADGETQR